MLVIIFVLTPNLDMYPLKLPFEIAHGLTQLSRGAIRTNSPHAYLFGTGQRQVVFEFLMRACRQFFKTLYSYIFRLLYVYVL
jgi:hypothetical protein